MDKSMSFRTEDKFNLSYDNIYKLKKFFLENEIKKIYPDRYIISLYFDTVNLDMFNDSEEGVHPRKKIRIRLYDEKKMQPENIKKVLFEKKITAVEGKFKVSKEILFSKKIIKQGFLDDDYGQCLPCVYTKYKRSYFLYNDSRVTIDTDVRYAKFNNINTNFQSYDRNLILEIKSNEKNYNNLLNSIPLIRLRHSKFCEAIKNLLF